MIIDYYIEERWIKVDYYKGYKLYNYTPKTVYHGYWDDITLNCRGLILNKNNEVVALPFPKFFNLDEVKETKLENLPGTDYTVFKKYDGSLGILWSTSSGERRIATRGCFTSDQAEFATELWNRRYPHLYYDNLTLLFEIIYPEDSHIVNYGNEERLVLLGAREINTGRYLSYSELKSLGYDDVVESVPHSLEDILLSREYDSGIEGYVIQFHTDPPLLVKIKTEEFKRLHANAVGFSKKKVLENLDTWDEFITNLPEEFKDQAILWKEEITDYLHTSEVFLREVYEQYSSHFSKKEFAIETKDFSHPFYHIRRYIFHLYDGKDVVELLLKDY